MTTTEFENIVERHSLCPGNIAYNTLALAGEVGEVANMVKKREIAILKPEWVTANEGSLPYKEDFDVATSDELGDALFYLTRTALDKGLSLQDLMVLQEEKLRQKSVKYNRIFLK